MFRVGAASTVITPPVGTSLAGYFHDRVSTAVHDDLRAKALVIESGGTKVAIVVCDLLRVTVKQVAEIRKLASDATGIPDGSIWVSATHAHTGPETNTDRPMVPFKADYLAALTQTIADAIIEANGKLQPATLRLGEEYEDGVAFNRRFRMKDGSVKFNPGQLNPDIVGPDGPIDPQVNVLRIDGQEGQPIAILSCYSLHVDVMTGCEISADFPGEMSRLVSSVYDSKPLVIFLQGTCGNINHIDVTTNRHQSGWGQVTRIARVLAGKTLAASELSEAMESDALGVATEILPVKYHPMTDEVRARAAAIRANPNAHENDVAAAVAIENYKLDGQTAQVEVQAIRVGDTAFVGIPGEYFVEYGLSIKEWSPFCLTFVGELANGAFGYIPTQDAFYPGTYETTPVLSATLEQSAGVRIANAAGELLRGLAE